MTTYHSVRKLNFDEMMMMATLHSINTQKWVFIVLGHCINSAGIDMPLQWATLSKILENQYLHLLLNSAYWV